jgi:hypothetical protein
MIPNNKYKKYLPYMIVWVFLLLSSCGVQKKKSEVDLTKITKDIERKTVYRPSDTIVSETKYNVKYKDTTITTTNYKTNTILREIYDDQGNRRTECIPEEIKEEFETIREEIHNDIQTLKETDHSFDPTPLIWAMVGLGVIFLLIALGGLYAIISLKKALPSIVSDIINSKTS